MRQVDEFAFNSNVQPRRRVRQEKRQAWTCKCEVLQPAGVKRCFECMAVRP